MNERGITVEAAVESSTLEDRIAALEAVEAIKALKYRYVRACDAKDPAVFRSCFVRHGAVLDYGPRIGRYDDAEGIVEVFRKVALNKVDGRYVVYDMHHALHPDIRITGPGEAEGSWTLRFRQVDILEGVERVSAIEYADRYVVEDGAWRIASCQVSVLWTLAQPLAAGYEITSTLP